MIALEKQGLRRLDWLMIACVFLICSGGILAIRSALHQDAHALDFVHKQIAGVIAGAVLLAVLALSDYSEMLRRLDKILYWGNLAMLVVVLKAGHASHGAQRWIGLGPVQIQPSEFAKLVLICTLAMYLVKHRQTLTTWQTLLKSLVHIGIPMLLIAKQPDLGTALVILAIWFGMTALAGARPLHLLTVLIAGALIFGGLWHFDKLKDYQKNRLQVFLDPNADPRDAGYHLRQSEIAIGSGKISGEGYDRGTQSKGQFIPEQHTDFIFTIVGEEGGFLGCVVLLGLYLVILERGVVIMAESVDKLGRLLAAGILSLLVFHVVVNAGMTMGVMPVVGVPLPFFSYGLSSLLVNMACIGLLLSIAAHKQRTVF